MEMKRGIGLFVILLVTAAVFSGCLVTALVFSDWQGSSVKKDGTYRAKFENAVYDWTEYVELTIADGQITAVDYDAVNAKGEKKSQDAAYDENMKSGNESAGLPAIGPSTFYAEYEQALLQAQDVDGISAVAGATQSYNNFKILVNALSKKIATGDTSEAIVRNAE